MGKIYLVNSLGNEVTLNEISIAGFIISLIILIAAPVALYLLRSIGIYKLAKNHGIDKAFMAWIPFAWIYPLCLLVKEYTFFGTPYGNIALIVCTIFCVYGGLSFLYKFFVYLPLILYFFSGGAIYLASGLEIAQSLVPDVQSYWLEGIIFVSNIQYYGNSVRIVAKLLTMINTIISLLDIVQFVVLINIYIVLFRKFWPKHYIVASVMSAFGLFNIFIFIIRNRVALSFEQYVRTMNSGMNNGRYKTPTHTSKKDEPFAEFGDDDPFSDF